ncbi:hypothetical protein fs1p08 [Fibrovirus fs1]|uniref:Uncharacterized protein n=1 Tax=Fibrovirus fs1 TaxID=70203 RepID=O56841_9VIRU|nr:hypothetical protein fs1p08 [Fibrovirus fs1]BAA24168.1 hypothetical protein [Fibrovirus fs1]
MIINTLAPEKIPFALPSHKRCFSKRSS